MSANLKKTPVTDYLKLSGNYNAAKANRKNKFISFKKSRDWLLRQGYNEVKNGKYEHFSKKTLTGMKPFTMEEYNSVQVEDPDAKQSGGKLTSITAKFGKPDETTESNGLGTYTWYTNPDKTGYFTVDTNKNKEITSKSMTQPNAQTKKASPQKYEQIKEKSSQVSLI